MKDHQKTFPLKMIVPDVQNLQWQARSSVQCTKIIIKDYKLFCVKLVKCNKGHVMPPNKKTLCIERVGKVGWSDILCEWDHKICNKVDGTILVRGKEGQLFVPQIKFNIWTLKKWSIKKTLTPFTPFMLWYKIGALSIKQIAQINVMWI